MMATTNHFLGNPTQNWPPQEDNLLYRAQASSDLVFQTSWFPCYTKDYIQTQEGIKGFAISGYSMAYNGISMIGSFSSAAFHAIVDAVQKVAFAIIWVGAFNSSS